MTDDTRAYESGLACLRMYDLPEVREATDSLWASIAARLRACGIAAPETLDRTTPREDAWLAPSLVLGQTCGLPFMRGLKGKVVLLGSPVYDLPSGEPGDYCSVLVARSDDASRALADFRGRRAAYNGTDSQSGYAALQHAVAPLAHDGRFFGEALETGAHLHSATAVAEGRADIAAIDAVTWELAKDHLPATAALKVIAETAQTPGLPYITALAYRAQRTAMAEAIDTAIADLAPETRRRLKLKGFRARPEADYAVLLERLDAADAAGYRALP